MFASIRNGSLLAIFLLLAAYPAFAGYYGVVTYRSSSANGVLNPEGTTSQCLLTPSMASKIGSVSANTPIYLTSLTETAASGYATNSTYSFQVAIYECTALPAATALPTFLGGVTDPVIESGTFGGGAGGGTGECTSAPATIEALNPQLAIDDAVAFFGLALLLLSLIWAGKTIYTIFTRDQS